jgi:hypothetical protein
MRKLWKRLQTGEITVSVSGAVALARLAHDQEHDRAIIERDQAVRERDDLVSQFHEGLWIIRNAIVHQHGPEAWSAIASEIRKLRPLAV